MKQIWQEIWNFIQGCDSGFFVHSRAYLGFLCVIYEKLNIWDAYWVFISCIFLVSLSGWNLSQTWSNFFLLEVLFSHNVRFLLTFWNLSSSLLLDVTGKAQDFFTAVQFVGIPANLLFFNLLVFFFLFFFFFYHMPVSCKNHLTLSQACNQGSRLTASQHHRCNFAGWDALILLWTWKQWHSRYYECLDILIFWVYNFRTRYFQMDSMILQNSKFWGPMDYLRKNLSKNPVCNSLSA